MPRTPTFTLIVEQLRELGIDISSGQVNRILICDKESFHAEQKQVLQAGLETAEYVHTDDTGARHQGKNGYCTVIGNDLFTYFSSSESKSRENYLRRLIFESMLLDARSVVVLDMMMVVAPVIHLLVSRRLVESSPIRFGST